MTTKFIAEKAFEMTMIDAIERGCTKVEDAVEYMKTKTFQEAMDRYIALFEEQFPELTAL